MSKQFYFKQFSLPWAHSLVLFDPQTGPYQELQLWARVDQGAMVIKEYSAFPKAPALLEPHHLILLYHTKDTCWWGEVLPLSRGAVGVFWSPSQTFKLRLQTKSARTSKHSGDIILKQNDRNKTKWRILLLQVNLGLRRFELSRSRFYVVVQKVYGKTKIKF